MDSGEKILAGLVMGMVMIGIMSSAVMSVNDITAKQTVNKPSNANLVSWFDKK